MKVFKDRSVLVFEDGSEVEFWEGQPTPDAKQRLDRIRQRLKEGWLDEFFNRLPASVEKVEIDDFTREIIEQIVNSITSEVGRAVAGLTVLQLVVKSLAPEQSIRLHKGGRGNFSWREGIPMRSLDSEFVTPFLRKYDLIRLNKYGVFMTRSLAENYPYSQFYKASIRGARDAWLTLIDKIESGEVNSETALCYMLAALRNRSESFKKLLEKAFIITQKFLKTTRSLEDVFQVVVRHVNESPYSARLLEVSMHAFLQVLEDRKLLSGYLLPLCQMRTANKKHRNVADIEIVSQDDPAVVLEA